MSPHPGNANWTSFEQTMTANFTDIFGSAIKLTMERFAETLFLQSAKRGADILEDALQRTKCDSHDAAQQTVATALQDGSKRLRGRDGAEDDESASLTQSLVSGTGHSGSCAGPRQAASWLARIEGAVLASAYSLETWSWAGWWPWSASHRRDEGGVVESGASGPESSEASVEPDLGGEESPQKAGERRVRQARTERLFRSLAAIIFGNAALFVSQGAKRGPGTAGMGGVLHGHRQGQKASRVVGNEAVMMEI